MLKLLGDGDGRVLFRFFFQAEDGIRDLVRSRGLGDVYKRQVYRRPRPRTAATSKWKARAIGVNSSYENGIE